MSSVWAQYLDQSQMNISGWEEPCWSLPVTLIQFILRIIIDTKLCKGSCITLAPKKLYFSKESILKNEINKTECCIDRLPHHCRSSLGVLYPFWSLTLIFFFFIWPKRLFWLLCPASAVQISFTYRILCFKTESVLKT